MIDTLFFVLQIMGIVVLLVWAVIHDQLADGAPTRGPLAFKGGDYTGAGSGQGRRGGRSLTRLRGRANVKKPRSEPE